MQLDTRLFSWLSLSALIVLLDQATKYWMLQVLQHGQQIAVTSFFDLVLVYNPGAAFSFLSHASGWQRWFFIVLALGISVWLIVLLRRHASERLLPLALALILGGALGNVIDRFVHGAVVDFLSLHAGRFSWPAFNVADSAITIGALLMVWSQFQAHPSQSQSQ